MPPDALATTCNATLRSATWVPFTYSVDFTGYAPCGIGIVKLLAKAPAEIDEGVNDVVYFTTEVCSGKRPLCADL